MRVSAIADDLAVLVGTDSEIVVKYFDASTAKNVLERPRQEEGIIVEIGETRMSPTKGIKYLGLVIHHQDTFVPHIRDVVDVSGKRVMKLTRMMLNIEGFPARIEGYYQDRFISRCYMVPRC